MANDYIYVNGNKQYWVKPNNTHVCYVHANGVLVYDDTLKLSLPNPGTNATTINLQNFINSNNPHGRYCKVEITNTHIQPHMTTGNLGSFTHVKFTNTSSGQIQGTSSIKDALTLTSDIQLVNQGWIRGAGGDGGRGGRGGNGGRGGTGGNAARGRAPLDYKYHGGFGAMLNGTGDWEIRAPHDANSSDCTDPNSGIWALNNYSCFGNQGVSQHPTEASAKAVMSVTLQNNQVVYRGKRQADSHTACVAKDRQHWQMEVYVDGGKGGKGGAGSTGGAGGSGGRGIFFHSTNTGGGAGVNVGPGTKGTKGTKGELGCADWNDGGTGGTGGGGGTGGTGGAGGTWGTKGANGVTGANGGNGANGGAAEDGISGTNGTSGTSGAGGTGGTAAGRSIVGTRFLLGSSNQGNINGATSA